MLDNIIQRKQNTLSQLECCNIYKHARNEGYGDSDERHPLFGIIQIESTAISTRANWHLYSKLLGNVTFNEVNSPCCAGKDTGNLPPQDLLSSE